MSVRRPGLLASNEETHEEEEIFAEGDVIDQKFKVLDRLGRGGYGA